MPTQSLHGFRIGSDANPKGLVIECASDGSAAMRSCLRDCAFPLKQGGRLSDAACFDVLVDPDLDQERGRRMPPFVEAGNIATSDPLRNAVKVEESISASLDTNSARMVQ